MRGAEQIKKSSRKPLSFFRPCVQDLGDILYGIEEQKDDERYVDFAQRIVDALESKGWEITGDADDDYDYDPPDLPDEDEDDDGDE